MMQPLQNKAEPRSARDPRSTRDARPALTLVPAYDQAREALVRTLALDRIRELHDDGVTMEYVGRMYGVSGEYLADLESELRLERKSHYPAPDRLFTT
jgi:hypothetical protein